MAGHNDQRDRQHGQNADHQPGQRQQSQQGAGERQHGQNPGDFANDRDRASEAGKKGAAKTEQQRHQDAEANKQQK